MSELNWQEYGLLARDMDRLRTRWRLDVPEGARAAAGRLALGPVADSLPPMIAVVGGASSGKSTVFNNLLAGHQSSGVTAKGHATLGPILAAHERNRAALTPLLHEGSLFPGYRTAEVELDAATTGDPHTLSVVFHPVEALAEALLFDMPDFTSLAAEREGDVTLSLLPWFDALVVVVDHERWFDRQSMGALRGRSVQYGQRRMVLFNRAAEGQLAASDRRALEEQAQRLGAEDMLILEFRCGRGFLRFPPGTLDAVLTFMKRGRGDRRAALRGVLREAAEHVLNQNAERQARLAQLRNSLEQAVIRRVPSREECLTALMSDQERRNLDAVSRVLRLRETGEWLAAQSRRLQRFFRQVPVLGSWVGDEAAASPPTEVFDRLRAARVYHETLMSRLFMEVRQLERSSAFWEELRRWNGMEPPPRDPPRVDPADMEAAASALDQAMTRWMDKVDKECAGLAPHLKGALGVGTVGLALVLIAVPGPLAALTAVAAKGAVAAALTHLLMAGGAGALLGKHLSRLTGVVQEKLLGSAEWTAVREAAENLRGVLEQDARRQLDPFLAEAQNLVLDEREPLRAALECVTDGPGRG